MRPINRRRFLRRTIAGAALLAVGATVGKHLTGYALDGAIAARLRTLSPKEYLILAAACRRLLAADEPGAPSPDEVGAALVIDGYLAGLPDEIVSDVKALLHLIEHTPFLFHGKPSRFTRLDAGGQDAVLRGYAESRLDVKRRGFQALKSLAVLGYWGDPRTFALIGYPGPMPIQR